MDGDGRRAQDLLDSIFRVATELVRGERASLMLRDEGSSDFVIARAIGLAEDVKRQVRIREGEGVAGRVVASRRSLLVRVREDGPAPTADRTYRTSSFMSVPIVVENELLGVLNVADPVERAAFGESDLETLEVLASHIGACLVEQEQDEARERLVDTDPLTLLFNRRHFDRRLEGETSRAVRMEHLLALLMIDVDTFKSINDRFGHRVGDQVLRGVATAIKQAVRLYDVPTRYGGDEFAVILPDTDTESAARVARRILEKTAALDLPEMAAAGRTVSVSIGIATFPRPSADVGALVEAADTAMYRAKRSGGGLRVWEHALADGPRGALRASGEPAQPPAPYLADPARLATKELQAFVPRGLASEWNAVVVGKEGQVLTVAMPLPNAVALEALSRASGYAIYPVYSSGADLEATRRRLGEAG